MFYSKTALYVIERGMASFFNDLSGMCITWFNRQKWIVTECEPVANASMF